MKEEFRKSGFQTLSSYVIGDVPKRRNSRTGKQEHAIDKQKYLMRCAEAVSVAIIGLTQAPMLNWRVIVAALVGAWIVAHRGMMSDMRAQGSRSRKEDQGRGGSRGV